MKYNIFKKTFSSFRGALYLFFMESVYKPSSLLVNFIGLAFLVLTFISSVIMCKLFYHGLMQILDSCAKPNNPKLVEETIKHIEILFVAPLPLAIIFTFFSYAKRVIFPKLTDSQMPHEHVDTLADIAIIKYLFISTLISTLAIVILQTILELRNERYNISTILHIGSAFGLIVILLIYYRLISHHLQENIILKNNLEGKHTQT